MVPIGVQVPLRAPVGSSAWQAAPPTIGGPWGEAGRRTGAGFPSGDVRDLLIINRTTRTCLRSRGRSASPRYSKALLRLLEAPRTSRSARFELPLGPDAPRLARHATRDVVESWPEVDGDLAYDAQLVASEFVTNAVVHGGEEVMLEMHLDGRSLVVAVCDGSGVMPAPREATDNDESGRGLRIVSALAENWGVDSVPGGHKRVWARMPLGSV